MSIFGMIKDAIFGAVGSAQAQASQPQAMPQLQPGQSAPPPGQGVDVEQVLTRKAQEKGNPDLN